MALQPGAAVRRDISSPERELVLRRVELHNALMWAAISVIYTFAIPLLPTSLISAIMVRLGGTDMQIGLLATVGSLAGIPSMLISAMLASRVRRLPLATAFWQIFYFVTLLPPVLILWRGGRRTSLSAFIGAVLVCYLMAALPGALASVLQVDLLGRITRPQRRGRMVGYVGSLCGLITLFAGATLSVMLARWPFPRGYIIACVVGVALASISFLFALGLRELPGLKPSRAQHPSFRDSLKVIVHDQGFRLALLATILKNPFQAAMVFVIPTALRRLDLPDSFVGQYAIVGGIVTMLGSSLQGWSADRLGIGRTAFFGGLLGAIGIFWLPHVGSLPVMLACAALLTLGNNTLAGMFFLMPLSLATPEHRPSYIALRYVAESLGNATFVALLGFILTRWNSDLVFYVAGVLCVLSPLLLVHATGWRCRPDYYRKRRLARAWVKHHTKTSGGNT